MQEDIRASDQSFGRSEPRGGFIPKHSSRTTNDFGDISLLNAGKQNRASSIIDGRRFGRGGGISPGYSFGRGGFGSSTQVENRAPLPGQSFGRGGISSKKLESAYSSSFSNSAMSDSGSQFGRQVNSAFGSSIKSQNFSSGFGSSFGATASSFGGSDVNCKENSIKNVQKGDSSTYNNSCMNRFQGHWDDRPMHSNFSPEARNINDLFKEDADHAESYALIADDDEEITVSGANVKHTAIVESWKDAGFEPKLFFNIVERAKYIRPRKIQSQTIPIIMDGRDVMGHAETGSGKTAAFLLPIINQVMKINAARNNNPGKPSPFAIIVEPTRELCVQVYEQGLKFASETGVFVTRAYGQFNLRQNMAELQAGCDILCATPGRLKHLIMHNMISLEKLKMFVLDEADNLLEDNFLDDVRSLLDWPRFPKRNDRQTLLFSATFTELIQKLAVEVLKPDSVMVSNKKLVSANSKVAQRFMLVAKHGKKDALLELLQKEIDEAKKNNPRDPNLRRTLVFVRMKRDADLISLYLSGKNIKATTINGDRPQELREQALRDFRNNKVSVLVATDVCARGLDIKDLDHVINFDLPNDAITYIHRIGRTGRIKNGVATSFFDEYEPNDCNLAGKLIEFVRGAGQIPPEFLKKVVDGSGVEKFLGDDDW